MSAETKIPSEKRLASKPSFNSKDSLAHMNPSGSFSRPAPHIPSTDKDPGMTDKLHSLMDSYLPKDISSIQRAYFILTQHCAPRGIHSGPHSL